MLKNWRRQKMMQQIGYDNTIALPTIGVKDEEELFKDNQKNIITL
jgi:hypothetical protein